MKADGNRRHEHYDPMSVLEARYSVEYTRQVTSEMKDWVMEYVQMQKNQGPTPSVYTSFCSLMKFWEQKHLKGHLVPLRVKKAI